MSDAGTLDSTAALALLRETTSGLLYQSESEAPFEAVHLPPGTNFFGPAEALKVTGQHSAAGVEESTLARFFEVPTKAQDWHGEAEKADVARYRALQAIFTDRLNDAKHYRIGRIQVHVVIAGKTTDGHWVGVKTLAIET